MNRPLLVIVTAVNVMLVGAVWLGLAGPGGAQDSTPDVVRARTFELVNAGGDVVGQLYTGDDGHGNLRFRDASGTVRVKLGAASDGSGLVLMTGGDPVPGVTAKSDEQGTSLVLSEPGARDRVLRPRP